MSKRFALLVSGSRTISDSKTFYATVDRLLSKRVEAGDEITIVVGDARGVDELARNYAVDRHLNLQTFKAYWDLEGKSAGMKRNNRMFKHITDKMLFDECGCFAMWDGQSKGTLNAIKQATGLNIPLRVWNKLKR